MKRILRKLFSMKAAMVILILLIIACVGGSLITQQQTASYYTSNYSEKVAQLIMLIDLDDVFHSWWFIILVCVLCVNLLGCNLVHFPAVLKKMRSCTPEKRITAAPSEPEAILRDDPGELFKRMGFRSVSAGDLNGTAYMYSVRNRVGLWGAWLTHLAILIIIIGFSLGQIFTVKYTVYGVAGQTKAIENTPYSLTIDDFDISLREDETVEQYTAKLTMTNTETGEAQSGEASVNNPLELFGYQLYQNSTGWAANVRVTENDEPLQQEVLCAGEYLEIADKPGLIIYFSAFYPDYVNTDNGPATAGSQLNNPGYLYMVYYNNNVIGMNVLVDDYISIDEYNIYFEDPQQYTLIQIKRDPFSWIAAIGGILILIAVFLAFYCRTEELWAVQTEDGNWALRGESRKGGVLFHENLVQKAKESGGKVEDL